MFDLDYHALLPEIILAVTVLLTLVVDLVTKKKQLVAITAMVGMFAAIVPVTTLAFCDSLEFCTATGADRILFGGSYVIDSYSLVLKGVFIFAAFIALLLSVGYLQSDRYYEGEYFFLLVASAFGAVAMASSRDFITMIVALELVTGPAFLLAGWRKADPKSNEAALKFFITGVLALALTLFGVSLLYGLTGTQQFSELAAVAAEASSVPLFSLGVIFIILGFGFKVSAVPFHFWTPDTYEGAPPPVTAWLSVGSKGAGFVGLLTIAYVALPTVSDIWGPVLWVVAVLSMTIGNVVAIKQTNIIRLLGYSSIAQAGFMLAPFGAAAASGAEDLSGVFAATVTYLVIYTVMNLGAFAAVIVIGSRLGSFELEDWGGLNRYASGLALVLAMFFMSLAGIPPLAGWFAKFAMFTATIGVGNWWGYSIAIVAALNAVIAFVYYSKVVKVTFFDTVPEGIDTSAFEDAPLPGPIGFALGLTAFGVVLLGVFPGLAANLGDYSAQIFAALGL
ncbi:MAG: NADH-quinone oxidoreductase subunit NuoN [Proteobacteria bacterium]|nr:NADH-quinone oxidoreductase subunit NuoN [Pseudomonadota bacterium]